MKRMPLLLASLLLMAATFTSCKPSRVWATKDKKKDKYEKETRYEDEDRYDRRDRYETPPPPPARYYSNVALVISPTPGFVMNRSNDGRYYHRTAQGYLYWKGYDDRFFIDRSHLNNIRYSQWEYQQWSKLSGLR